MGRTLALVLACLISAAAIAQAAGPPSSGAVYSGGERRALSYDCKATPGGELECKFVETQVRKDQEPDDLGQAIWIARRGFRRSPSEYREQSCESWRATEEALVARTPPGRVASLPRVQKADALALARAIGVYCGKPTEDNYVKIVALNHSRGLRTCVITSKVSIESFRRSQSDGPNVWISRAETPGACGVVQHARFEPAGSGGEDSWKYTTWRTVTNPTAEKSLGVICKQFETKQSVYDGQSPSMQMKCDYIEFGEP